MQTISLERSVEMIPDGASLMIGGFMAVGTPERVVDELVRQEKRDLTVIANDTATPTAGSASSSPPNACGRRSSVISASIPRPSAR